MRLTEAERTELLRLARTAIARVIGVVDDVSSAHGVRNETADEVRPAQRRGAFVSIHVGNDLRGCIGYPESDLPLAGVVERCAASAATSDPRFPALSASEWLHVEIEISVLGAIEPVADISEIEIGRHGLIVELGNRRGLLLPQVAAEWGWNSEEFAGHVCRKAGLPNDAWCTGARLFKFDAEVFST